MDNWYDQNKDDLNYYFQKIINLIEDEEITINYDYDYLYEKYISFIFSQNHDTKKHNIPLPLKNLPKHKAKFTILSN